MKIGTLVRIKDPNPDEDGRQTYKVLEDRGDRVLAEAHSGFDKWAIKPTFVFDKRDVKAAVTRRR